MVQQYIQTVPHMARSRHSPHRCRKRGHLAEHPLGVVPAGLCGVASCQDNLPSKGWKKKTKEKIQDPPNGVFLLHNMNFMWHV